MQQMVKVFHRVELEWPGCIADDCLSFEKWKFEVMSMMMMMMMMMMMRRMTEMDEKQEGFERVDSKHKGEEVP